MKILIIDDEPSTAKFIENTLIKNYGADHCIKHVTNAQDSISLLKENFSIVLFKVNLKDGNCFEILDKVDHKKFKSIFITNNHNQNDLIKAVKFESHDFLHFPFDSSVLINSTDTAIEKISEEKDLQKMDLLFSLKKDISERHNFKLLNGNSQEILISDIVYFEADKSVTHMYLLNNRKKVLPKNIGCYKELLCNQPAFKSISKSILINLSHFKSYDHKKLEINLQNGITLSASRRGGKDLKEYLHNFQPDGLATMLNSTS